MFGRAERSRAVPVTGPHPGCLSDSLPHGSAGRDPEQRAPRVPWLPASPVRLGPVAPARPCAPALHLLLPSVLWGLSRTRLLALLSVGVRVSPALENRG